MSTLKVNEIYSANGSKRLVQYNQNTGQLTLGDSTITGNLTLNINDVTLSSNLAVVTTSTTNLLRINNSIAYNRDTPRVTLDLGDSTSAMLVPRGTTAQRPGSPVSGMIRYNTSDNQFEMYNGTTWKQLNTVVPANGLSAAGAGDSAKAIKTLTGTNSDGVYWIKVNGTAEQVYCLMGGPNGGGWMMLLKADTSNTFNYDSGYWTNTSTLNTGDLNRNSGNAKWNTYNYSPLTDLLAIWPDVGNTGSGCDANSGYGYTFRDNGRLSNESARSWWGRVNNYQTSGNPRDGGTCWWNGSIFSAQGGFQWAGYNYTTNTSNKVRWGFAWNNETDQGSNDTSGGIGMNRRDASAGDIIGCCQTTNGINRSARVEIYGR